MTTWNDRPEGGPEAAEMRCMGDTDSVPDPTATAELFDAEAWRSEGENIILKLAESGALFGADDVRAAGLPEPDVPNRWGPLFAAMHGRHLIERVGFVVSGRRARRGGAAFLWRGVPARRDADVLGGAK